MWYRIFARSGDEVAPAMILEHLHAEGFVVPGRFRGDDLGWTTAELPLAGGSPILLSRYLTTVDDLRHDLNTWAAELETRDYDPNHIGLMERVIQSQQLITIRKPVDHSNEVTLDRFCLSLVHFLATATDGIYQFDGAGWFDATGVLLLREY